MAGLNAARRAGGAAPDRVLTRGEAYTGVLVDDLVLQGVTEPYRMLTARSEFRLALRADNAGLRLTEKGIAWGVVGAERARAASRLHAAILADALARARAEGGSADAGTRRGGVPINQDGRWRSALEALALPAMAPEAADRLFPWLRDLPPRVRAELEAQALYAPYLERQAAELRVLEREERLAIPRHHGFRHHSRPFDRDAPAPRQGLARRRSAVPAGCPVSRPPRWPPSPSICAGSRRVSRETGRPRRFDVPRETAERCATTSPCCCAGMPGST